MKNRRIRVLLLAEACNPEWTSVPLVGYNLYRALRERVDVTLVTQIRNRKALLRNGDGKHRIEFIDSELLAAPFHRLGKLLTLGKGLGWTTKQAVMWLPYIYYEYLVYKKFRRALEQGDFDIIHRITPLSPTYPSPIALWSTVPFVLGPINGGLPWPKGTTRNRLAEMEWLSYIRHAYRILPFVRSTYQRAAFVIAGSQYTLSALPRVARQSAVYLPENGINPDLFHADGRPPPSKIAPFRILFVGRLVPYKGADIILEAFASSAQLRSHAEVVIVGGGPQNHKLKTMAASFGITDRVTFTGSLPHSEVMQHLRRSSVFAFPSMREFGGAVVIEAMACGLPPIVLDYGGPAEIITEATGVRLQLGTRSQIIATLRAALDELGARRDQLDIMSRACIEHAKNQFTWEAKAYQIRDVYRSAFNSAHC